MVEVFFFRIWNDVVLIINKNYPFSDIEMQLCGLGLIW